MPTYVYETTGAKKRRFELRQSMNDPALTKDPETGEPVRRVISGGYGFIEKGSSTALTQRGNRSAHSCGTGCGCC